MGLPITSIGTVVSYVVESTAGTRPSTGYTKIHNLKEFPDTNVEPNTADATTFDQTKNTISVTLLKDLSGVQSITANLCDELYTEWGGLVTAYETAKASNKATWLCVAIPDFTKALYIPIEPQAIDGFSGISANSLQEITVYFTIVGDTEFDTKPTYATSSSGNGGG